jgi:hypothetical protein
VGGDWINYIMILHSYENFSLSEIYANSDPGYTAINVISNKIGFGITGVNVFCALIFSIGLVLFCKSLPNPWLAMACAVPYLIIVVAMGYTRQGIALGFVMIGLIMLARERFLEFSFWVLLGALFHKTAVLLIPIAALTILRNILLNLVLISVATAMGYIIFLADSVDKLMKNYTDDTLVSEGAFIRLCMNAIAAFLFFIFRKKFEISLSEEKIWKIFSILAIGMIVLFNFTSLSTALDRMSLYIIPLQLFVFANMPGMISKSGRLSLAIKFGILLYFGIVLFVWLNFATHAEFWLPYQMGMS